jgi:hypothetical protein
MFFYLQDNWTRWKYAEHHSIFRQSTNDTFQIELDPCFGPVASLREEAVKACRSIRDAYPNEQLCLMFSGGAESEIMVRAFLAAKIPFDVYIARFERDYNIYDVSHAVVACESMQVPYKIIDFNLEHFFEHRAEHYACESQIYEPLLLPHLAFSEIVNGVPILAGGEVALQRSNTDYSTRGTWLLEEKEYNWGWAKYFLGTDRPAIPDWCRWTQNLYLSWMQLNWFKRLVNDEYYGKLGINSTKIQGYREAWPELVPRVKAHGFEHIGNMVAELEKYLDHKYNRTAHETRLTYTIDEFHKIIKGTGYES